MAANPIQDHHETVAVAVRELVHEERRTLPAEAVEAIVAEVVADAEAAEAK